MKDYFNNRWKQLPPKTAEAESPPNVISPILPVEKEEKKKESTSKRTNFASAGAVGTSTSSKSLDDDDQIDLLLINVNEKLSELQQYSQELISLRFYNAFFKLKMNINL